MHQKTLRRMPGFNYGSSRPGDAYIYPAHQSRPTSFMLPIQQLPRLNTNVTNDSNESLNLPIQLQHVKPQYPPHLFSQVKRKPVPGFEEGRPDSPTIPANAIAGDLRRRSSDALGDFERFYTEPSDILRNSRDDLLRQTLVPQSFSSDRKTSYTASETITSINMRVEPDRSIRSPISPESVYQTPANLSWLQRSLDDPSARLREVQAEQKLRRGSAASRGNHQPKQGLQQRMKQKAAGEFTVLSNIRSERDQLQRTKRYLNQQNNDGYHVPLLSSRENEDSVADIFDREHQARLNGAVRRLPPQKLRKPQHHNMVEGRGGFVERASRYGKEGMYQEDFSGWYSKNRKRDRAWKKFKVILAKMINPRKNQWQNL